MTGIAVVGEMRREIGSWDCGRPGPTLMVLGGMHGNEPAGVRACQRVMAALQAAEPAIKGRFVALAGNLGALAEERRFLRRDLNRGWGPGIVDDLLTREPAALSHEDHEQRALLDRFLEVERTSTGPLVFIDLHTSSADGPPFICLADTMDNRRLAMSTGVPIILGIEETIDGASLEWFARRGIAGFAVEGGRHQSAAAVDNLEAVLWLLLVRLGMLPAEVADLEACRRRLLVAVGKAPPIVEIMHRQVITDEDRFVMKPGFVNFELVQKGQVLAADRHGEVVAQVHGHLMLPLYQKQGEDGFFLARRVRSFWLWLAHWLRTLHVGALLPVLPGIRRDPDDPDTLLADPRVARWFVVEIFHLLGFRKASRRGDRRAFSRRRSRPENRRL